MLILFGAFNVLLLGYAMYRIRKTQWWVCFTGCHRWKARWEQYPSSNPNGPFYFSHTHMVAWCDDCGHRMCMTLTGGGLAVPFHLGGGDGDWAPGFDSGDPAHVRDMGRPWDQSDADNPRFEARDGRGPW